MPETSKEAYNSLDPDDIREMYRKIMVALSALGSGTMEDISSYLKEPRERVWKRLSEMQRMDLIFRPGTKKLLKSGRNGFCWALTGTNLPKTHAAEKALAGKSVADYSREISSISNKTNFHQQELF